MKFILVLLAGFIALTVAGCTGSSGSSSNSANVSLYVTDNLTQDYTEVWVTIHSVSTTDNAGQTVSLFEDASGTGHVQNLRQLVNVGALLNTQNLSAGTYTDFNVTVSNGINMVDATGTTTNALFDNTLAADAMHTITVTGTMNVAGGQNVGIALDFDLAQFTYDSVTNMVNPVVVYQGPSQTNTLNRTYAEIEGYVTSIDGATSFTMAPEHNGVDVQVVLHNDAIVYHEHSMNMGTDTSSLRVGGEVEVYGNYDSGSLTLEAIRVKVEDGDDSNDLQEAEGTVVSFDSNSGILEINVHKADFIPGSDTLTVDISGAFFTRGSADILTAGMVVELKGSWGATATTFTVAAVEIEGAPHNHDMNHGDNYAEIKGMITDMNGNMLTLTITDAEHTSHTVGSSVTVDTTNAWFKEGYETCLAIGAEVEIKGPVDADMNAILIDVETDCNNDEFDHPELSGTVVSIVGDNIMLQVSGHEHFPAGDAPSIGDQVSVDISMARFEDGLANNLMAGSVVEVEGTWAEGVLTAHELEFEN